MSSNQKKPKVLIYDIETTPNLAYVWGKYEQNVIAYKNEWQILCFAYKWQGEKEIKCCRQRGKDDWSVAKKLWKLFDEADAVVAHNGDAFDQKKVRARFVYHKFDPPSPFVEIDTKKIAKRYFKFNSNKLDDLGQHLGLGRKVSHEGFSLWLGCMQNNSSSWKKMMAYNIQDVKLLEKIYLRFRPWMNNHPNLSLLGDRRDCPNCNSKAVHRRGKTVTHRAVKWRWQCQDCGAWFYGPSKKIGEYE